MSGIGYAAWVICLIAMRGQHTEMPLMACISSDAASLLRTAAHTPCRAPGRASTAVDPK